MIPLLESFILALYVVTEPDATEPSGYVDRLPILGKTASGELDRAERRTVVRDPTAPIMRSPGGRLNTSPRTIIIGAGAIGSAIAWRCAEKGATVTLIDPSTEARASSVAAGMLAPVTEVHPGEEPLLRLNLRSAEIYESWISDLERRTGPTGYRRTGTLMVARDSDDNAALQEVFELQLSLGLDVERLRSRDCRKVEGGLASSVRGGILADGDHQVVPSLLTERLHEACRSAGVETVKEAVAEIVTDGEVTGVRTTEGRTLPADRVVVAAGAYSGSIGGLPKAEFPVRGVKGQLLHLRADREPVPISMTVRGLDVYLVPRADGTVVVGATMEERPWDTTVTAGAVHDLLRYAYELVPGITEMEFVGALTGFRPATPDNAPLLGETSIPGLFAATGHYRNGILLTPITAEVISDLIVDGRTEENVDAFSPRRFAPQEVDA